MLNLIKSTGLMNLLYLNEFPTLISFYIKIINFLLRIQQTNLVLVLTNLIIYASLRGTYFCSN